MKILTLTKSMCSERRQRHNWVADHLLFCILKQDRNWKSMPNGERVFIPLGELVCRTARRRWRWRTGQRRRNRRRTWCVKRGRQTPCEPRTDWGSDQEQGRLVQAAGDGASYCCCYSTSSPITSQDNTPQSKRALNRLEVIEKRNKISIEIWKFGTSTRLVGNFRERPKHYVNE